MTSLNGQSPVLLEKVFEVIKKKLPADTAPLVVEFTERLYQNVSRDDLIGRDYSNIYGSVVSLWHSFNNYANGNEAQIRVYNPEASKHGWESPYTVVEIIQVDMPFMVDSVRMALNRFGIKPHLFLQAPFTHTRNEAGDVVSIVEAGKVDKNAQADTVFLLEIDRLTSADEIETLKIELTSVMAEIKAAVTDWQPMREKLAEIADTIEDRNYPGSDEDVAQAKRLLSWLADNNFTLMGYRGYTLTPVEGDYELRQEKGSSLGVMKSTESDTPRKITSMTKQSRHAALSKDELILVTKTNSKSRVHRPAYTDYLGIKRFDKEGNVIGEDRFIGLYSSSFYNDSAMDIPFVREKIQAVLEASKYAPNSHGSKAILNILQTYPRDELIQTSPEELLSTAMGVLQAQERDVTRLFIRRDVFGRFITAMVYVPKERYNTGLREKTQDILARSLGAIGDVEFNTYFSESNFARTLYTVRVSDSVQDINVSQIEQDLEEASRTWEDHLESLLVAAHGEAKAQTYMRRYADGFPRSYKEDILTSVAIADIDQLEALDDDHKLGMLFYRAQEVENDSNRVKLKLFHKDEPIHLSDVLPMLENFGLRIINESPYEITTNEGNVFWVLDFFMVHTAGPLDLDEIRENFQEAFARVWSGELEDDGFNRLVLSAGMSGRHVVILRMLAKYMRQIGVTFSQSYIENTFARYPKIAELIIKMFYTKFEPGVENVEEQLAAINEALQGELSNVASLDDDRIIGRYIDLIKAALRTNFFQKDESGKPKSYVSIKFLPEEIPEMPLPLLKYEVFVYSPRVEGIHLRGGKVSRGGLRWSDRPEDFRTEVLGLVKAQQVKNTVIVPVGAKGGFVAKKLPTERDAFFEEGKNCYRIFIRGLLDIADNIVEGEVVHAPDVVRYDEDDTYIVVAADKGTATFSDIANGIAAEYNFWLGDAFASGGSVGYDHKKMGITASGAWQSVMRHFREIGVDCQTTDFTCVGIGDMGGDVFGNGMLQSKHTKLVGAFNHMHIFVDPNPNPETTYEERLRLFKMPRSSWADFDKSLLSEGGGIFERSAKSINLTPQIQELVGTTKSSMTPNELIRALLMSEVDLIWNGGIGTYVKSSKESDIDVGDRANDPLRVNGEDIRAVIIGEGGNLGMTQLGRIEYANKGGRINTDFIDNVGGVSCSDNEVNIKILLNGLVNQGKLTREQRDEMLFAMTEDVREIVLTDAKRQTQSMSVTYLRGVSQIKEIQRFIHQLERDGHLDRAIEFLPSDDELADRIANGKGFTRPELAVLSAYGKMVLKDEFAIDAIANDPFHAKELVNSFPAALREKFADDMEGHPLRTEIIATKLANNMVNDMGPNFLLRKKEATGATSAEIAASYVISRELFEAHKIRAEIEALDNIISADAQNQILFQVRRLVRRTSRWFLRHKNPALKGIQAHIDFYKAAFDDLRENALDYITEVEAKEIKADIARLEEIGVPAALAQQVGLLSTTFSAMDIAEISAASKQEISTVAQIYFRLGAKTELHWFLKEVNAQPTANHWQALARAAFREELDWQQRELTSTVLRFADKADSPVAMLELWMEKNATHLNRWKQMLADFKSTQSHEFAKFSVALSELMMLGQHCGEDQ
ncbi:NAD-glutamate dehydrogenase [Aliidiomarina taiwanensis]|uniref:NAD-glutamate dehydrogenase n=1 Tax=Aliidiomarina taiwanensis TaxID=946228 RepID=A0A432X9X5_9GAMM|nr:NAD-glutamate dehydrogenase [Aliidiomarina taiwanensis]RUO44124.1 NAD-glutamate dehydrogenase [Aliidiomarina taiwanensis]